METIASQVPNIFTCSDFTKTFDNIYSCLPFDSETFVKSEDANRQKFVLSENIRTYPFSSTYIYCRFSKPKNRKSLKASSKRMLESEQSIEHDIFIKRDSIKDLPSLRSLLTLGLCVIYTTVLLLAASIGSRLLSSLRTTIVKHRLRFMLSTRLKSTQKIKELAPRHTGT